MFLGELSVFLVYNRRKYSLLGTCMLIQNYLKVVFELPMHTDILYFFKVRSTKIGAERCGFDPRFVRQFLLRIGKAAGRLMQRKFEVVSREFKPATCCGRPAM
jgi:hypothetical protein